MNTNSNLPIPESEKMSSIIIDIESDIESQNETKKEVQHEIKVPLRGILKNTKENIIYNDKIEQRFMKLCFALIILIIMTPIIFCDLYFGFTDLSCSREQPDELAITVKLYLIVSGFVGLSVMTAIFIGIACFDFDENYANDLFIMSCCSCGAICLELFNLVWNILGAVVFWEYIYGNGNCNKNFSTYVFVSLIIKFISILFGYHLNKKNNDRN
jgi:hypothetical protein